MRVKGPGPAFGRGGVDLSAWSQVLKMKNVAGPVKGSFDRLARTVLDAVLPPRCLSCGTVVAGDGALCPPCWGRLAFIGAPHCARCGLPFAFEVAPDALCGDCVRHEPVFGQARAALRYDDASRPLVLAFKHGDGTHAAPALGRWMAQAAGDLARDAELIVPVPLHRLRLFRRRYNQSALLARAVARLVDRPAAAGMLVRRRRTPSQGGLSRSGRIANVRGAFAIAGGRAPELRDRKVLLVDDVMTTGATLSECARVLRRAGAARVDLLTLARVVRPSTSS